MQPQPVPAQEQHDHRQADGNRAVERQSPRKGDEAVGVCSQHEEDDAADAAEREAEGRRHVAVLCSERTGGKCGDQLGERRGHEPRQRIGGNRRRLFRKPAGDQLAPEMREDRRQDRGGNGHRKKGQRVGPELRPEAPFRLSAGQVRDDDHPEGLGPEHEHEVDTVGGHEAVGLPASSEFVGQEGTGHSGGQTQGHI